MCPSLAIIDACQMHIRRQRRRLQKSSDTETTEDLDSDEYSYDSNELDASGSEENSSKHISFTELPLTPKRKRNYSHYETYEESQCDAGQKLFVDKEDLKNLDNTRMNKNCDDTNLVKKSPSKKTSSKKTESCYSAFALKMQ